jgi:hypothetical protein
LETHQLERGIVQNMRKKSILRNKMQSTSKFSYKIDVGLHDNLTVINDIRSFTWMNSMHLELDLRSGFPPFLKALWGLLDY